MRLQVCNLQRKGMKYAPINSFLLPLAYIYLYLRSIRIIFRPYPNELVQMMCAKNTGITR